MLATLAFAFLAGVLSLLSPCVLPLLPIVLGAAASRHRLGPLALSAGLALSFTTIGILVATVGFALGLDAGLFRTAARHPARRHRGDPARSGLPGARRPRGEPCRRLDREPLRRLLDRGLDRTVRGRAPPRSGLEPVRRADARGRLHRGRAVGRPPLGQPHHGGLRVRGRPAAPRCSGFSLARR